MKMDFSAVTIRSNLTTEGLSRFAACQSLTVTSNDPLR